MGATCVPRIVVARYVVMRKVLEEGITVCLKCGDGLDGALIDFEAERNEAEPDCKVCREKV